MMPRYHPETMRLNKVISWQSRMAIFKDMKSYLSAGNLRGLHSRALMDTMHILSLLYRIKPDVDSGQIPVLEDLWRLNQGYAEAHLLGQYTAEVFDRVK